MSRHNPAATATKIPTTHTELQEAQNALLEKYAQLDTEWAQLEAAKQKIVEQEAAELEAAEPATSTMGPLALGQGKAAHETELFQRAQTEPPRRRGTQADIPIRPLTRDLSLSRDQSLTRDRSIHHYDYQAAVDRDSEGSMYKQEMQRRGRSFSIFRKGRDLKPSHDVHR